MTSQSKSTLSELWACGLAPPFRYRQLREACGQRQVWVMPAFETPGKMALEEGRALVEVAVKGGKAALAPLISSGKLQGFAAVIYPRGHACTDFVKW